MFPKTMTVTKPPASGSIRSILSPGRVGKLARKRNRRFPVLFSIFFFHSAPPFFLLFSINAGHGSRDRQDRGIIGHAVAFSHLYTRRVYVDTRAVKTNNQPILFRGGWGIPRNRFLSVGWFSGSFCPHLSAILAESKRLKFPRIPQNITIHTLVQYVQNTFSVES